MVDIPNSVTQIGESAFAYCENLSLVLFNASKCTNEHESSHIIYGSPVRTLVIGSGVEQLPNSLLCKDYKTCNIVSLAQTPPLLYENTFSSPYNNNQIFTVYVPSDMYVNYWTDDIWGEMQIKEISIPVTDIVLSNEEMNVGIKSTALLTATIAPSNATIKDLYYSSSNPQIASVDVYGNVTGINYGEAFIFASAIDGSGVIAKCKVIVNNLVAESLELDPSEILLSVNKTAVVTPIYSPEGISNKEFEWSCSNEDVAKFRNNSDGSITVIGVSDGEAIITCHTTDGSDLTATCNVTVSTGTGVENTKSIAANVRGENGVIHIEGAEGAAVEVFNAAGVCIYSGTATEITVPQRGFYVVRVAGRATKLAL